MKMYNSICVAYTIIYSEMLVLIVKITIIYVYNIILKKTLITYYLLNIYNNSYCSD